MKEQTCIQFVLLDP